MSPVDKARLIYTLNFLLMALDDPKQFAKELKHMRKADDSDNFIREWIARLKTELYK